MRGAWLFLLLLAAPESVPDLVKTLDRFEREPFEQRKRESAIAKLGRIGTPESTRALEKLLEDPYLHLQDAAVSALIRLSRSRERAASLQVLGDLLHRRKRPLTRKHLATALGRIGDPAAEPALLKALRSERDPGALAAIAEALGRLHGPGAVAPLASKAKLHPRGRAACIRALGKFTRGFAWCLAYEKDPDDAVRAAVIDVCAARNKPVLPECELEGDVGVLEGMAFADALPKTKPDALARRRAEFLLRHPSWRVRAAAIEGVVARRDAALLSDLVERLEQERGRLRRDAWLALRRLTGKDIGTDPTLWRAILPMAELPPARARAAMGKAPAGTSSYFGLPVVSERIAFVFDASGSMRDEKKMVHAREQFASIARALTKRQRYDLFLLRFPSEHPPRPKLERAFGRLSPGKADAATSWLKHQPAKGWGAIYDALAAAIADDEVDTIYLLSDGRPSRGTVSRDFRVLQETRRLNRTRRVRIHTILLGSSAVDRKFMRDLAQVGGGIAVDGAGRRLE